MKAVYRKGEVSPLMKNFLDKLDGYLGEWGADIEIHSASNIPVIEISIPTDGSDRESVEITSFDHLSDVEDSYKRTVLKANNG